MNTTAPLPFHVGTHPSDRVSATQPALHNPVVQAFSIAAATVGVAGAVVICLGVVHALILMV
jgi:energy-converting hydrogenase Eha subunit E